MCQAIPRKVLRVEGDQFEVLIDERPTWVSGFEITGVQAGDYVVVYAGAVIQKVSEEEALEILDFLREMDAMFESDPLLEREAVLQ